MKSFKEHLFIDRILAEATKDCDEKFGKWVFANYQGKSEVDTDYEEDVRLDIEAYIHSGGSDTDSMVNAFQKLLDCKGSYKELQPSVRQISRGTNVLMKEVFGLQKPSKTETFDHLAIQDMVGKKWGGVPYTYKPRGKLSSFTSKVEVAITFANEKDSVSDMMTLEYLLGNMEKSLKEKNKLHFDNWKNQVEALFKTGRVPAIFAMEPDDRCVMNPDFSNLISFRLHGKEYEVTRVNKGGSRQIRGKLWIPVSLYDYKEKFTELVAKAKSIK